MGISCFDDLLREARRQPQPQRLLFVFTQAELPDHCTAEERAGFAAGTGGALIPLMCLDRTPDELSTFAMLAKESRRFALDWTVVFVAAISGQQARAPTTEEAEAPLNLMVAAIKTGSTGSFIPFDTEGEAMVFV